MKLNRSSLGLKLFFSCFVFLSTLAICEGVSAFLLNSGRSYEPLDSKFEQGEIAPPVELTYYVPTTLPNRQIKNLDQPHCTRKEANSNRTKGIYGPLRGLAQGPDPSAQYRVTNTVKNTGEIIYDVTYSYNQFGYRIVPQNDKIEKKRFFAFLGCSNVLGEGLEDGETLPAQFAKLKPELSVYNLSYHGYSPATLLSRARFEANDQIIKEVSGTFLYVFIPDHINRVIGSMKNVTTWGMYNPYFYEDSNGHVVEAGTFKSQRPALHLIYTILSHSYLLQLLNIDFPIRYSEHHLRLFVKVIDELRRTHLINKPDSKFYVLLNFAVGPKITKRLATLLSEFKIPFLIYTEDHLLKAVPTSAKIPGDCHPSAATNQLLADQLAIDLGLKSNNN